MSELEDLIRDALKSDDFDEEQHEPLVALLANRLMGESRWVALFAWMKMGGTLLISSVAAVLFFSADSTQAQITWATLFLTGFMGFAMWWIWYWMALNRNAALRELKRLEHQVAQLRAEQA